MQPSNSRLFLGANMCIYTIAPIYESELCLCTEDIVRGFYTK